MIDIENRIIAAVSERLAAKWPGMRLHSEEMRYPAKFPCAELYEMDNYVLESARDSGDIENFAQVTFQAAAYSNLSSGRKRQCREIFSEIDAEMARQGFIRTSAQPISMADATVYRLVGRYTAIADRDGTIYGRA